MNSGRGISIVNTKFVSISQSIVTRLYVGLRSDLLILIGRKS
jgi:hypothetical protein